MQDSSEDPSKSNAADGSSNHAVNPSDEVVLISLSLSLSAHTHILLQIIWSIPTYFLWYWEIESF